MRKGTCAMKLGIAIRSTDYHYKNARRLCGSSDLNSLCTSCLCQTGEKSEHQTKIRNAWKPLQSLDDCDKITF